MMLVMKLWLNLKQTPLPTAGLKLAVLFFMAITLLFSNAGGDATATAAPHFPTADDIRQTLQPVDAGELPIDVVVVLDDSGSVATCWPWPREGTPLDRKSVV